MSVEDEFNYYHQYTWMLSQQTYYLDRLEVPTNENVIGEEESNSLIEEDKNETIQVELCGDSFQPMAME